MKGLLVLADGFEDTEALTTRDVLTRAGIEVITVSIKDERAVFSSFGVEVQADTTYRTVNVDEYDFIILPGGGRGTRNLHISEFVKEALPHFKDKYMFAICAAPSVLGKYGYLDGKKFVCYPGFEEGIKGFYQKDAGVVVDGNIITGRSMGYSIDFGLAIVKLLLGQNAVDQVLTGVKGLEPKN